MDTCHSVTGRPSTGPKDPVSVLDLRKEAIRTPVKNMEKIRVKMFFSPLARNMRVEKAEDQVKSHGSKFAKPITRVETQYNEFFYISLRDNEGYSSVRPKQ